MACSETAGAGGAGKATVAGTEPLTKRHLCRASAGRQMQACSRAGNTGAALAAVEHVLQPSRGAPCSRLTPAPKVQLASSADCRLNGNRKQSNHNAGAHHVLLLDQLQLLHPLLGNVVPAHRVGFGHPLIEELRHAANMAWVPCHPWQQRACMQGWTQGCMHALRSTVSSRHSPQVHDVHSKQALTQELSL